MENGIEEEDSCPPRPDPFAIYSLLFMKAFIQKEKIERKRKKSFVYDRFNSQQVSPSERAHCCFAFSIWSKNGQTEGTLDSGTMASLESSLLLILHREK
jgi:hypothetical protein